MKTTSPKIRVAIFGLTEQTTALTELIAHHTIHGPTEHDSYFQMIGGYEIADLHIASVMTFGSQYTWQQYIDYVAANPAQAQMLTPFERASLPSLSVCAPALKIESTSVAEIRITNRLRELDIDVAIIDHRPTTTIQRPGAEDEVFKAARACANAGVPLLNASTFPVVAKHEMMTDWFWNKGLPLIGDGLQTQISDRYISQMLYEMFENRAVHIPESQYAKSTRSWNDDLPFPIKRWDGKRTWSIGAITGAGKPTTIEVTVPSDERASTAGSAADCLRLLTVASQLQLRGHLMGVSTWYCSSGGHNCLRDAREDVVALARRGTTDDLQDYNTKAQPTKPANASERQRTPD